MWSSLSKLNLTHRGLLAVISHYLLLHHIMKTVSPDLDLATQADEYAGIQLHEMRHNAARKILQYMRASQWNEWIWKRFQPTCKLYHYSAQQCGSYIGKNIGLQASCSRLWAYIISAYNRLKSTFRNSFDKQLIVDYLYIHINMPALSNFDARPAVLKWLSDNSRRKRDAPKSAKPSWFKTVFDIWASLTVILT